VNTGAPGAASTRPPLVGLGMPVFNGARFLAATLESILAQTLTDFELVICDNASTDATGEICRHYAATDARIRHVRNAANLGAHPNYNRCFRLSRGRYFKWTPHDDVLAPDYLAHCVGALEANPRAVLCQSQLHFIDAQGATLGICGTDLHGAQAAGAAERFAAAVLRAHNSYDMQGVFRREALERSGLLGSFHGADRALVAGMTLLGPFLHVPLPLLKVRDHSGRYTRAMVDPRARASWHDTRLRSRWSFPTWRLYRTHVRQVLHAPLTSGERSRCLLALLAWWFANWNAARAAIDVVGAFAPEAVGFAQRLKQSFSPAPGIDRARARRKRSPGNPPTTGQET
jgi:glycosyltransferase involved in cell wall biosynthesis